MPSHVREAYLYRTKSRAGGGSHRRNRNRRRPGKGKNKTKTNNTVIVDEEEIIQPPPTIILCTRPKAVAYIPHALSYLKALGICATALHSRLTQRERLNSLDLFRSLVIPELVSTDAGTKGLDIQGVALQRGSLTGTAKGEVENI